MHLKGVFADVSLAFCPDVLELSGEEVRFELGNGCNAIRVIDKRLETREVFLRTTDKKLRLEVLNKPAYVLFLHQGPSRQRIVVLGPIHSRRTDRVLLAVFYMRGAEHVDYAYKPL